MLAKEQREKIRDRVTSLGTDGRARGDILALLDALDEMEREQTEARAMFCLWCGDEQIINPANIYAASRAHDEVCTKNPLRAKLNEAERQRDELRAKLDKAQAMILRAEAKEIAPPANTRPTIDQRPDLYECSECGAKSGVPVLCARCLDARAKAGSAWIGPRWLAPLLLLLLFAAAAHAKPQPVPQPQPPDCESICLIVEGACSKAFTKDQHDQCAQGRARCAECKAKARH